jgi:6-phosphogluconolactonase
MSCWRVTDGIGGWDARMNRINSTAEIHILPDASALAEFAAGQCIAIANDSLTARGQFSISLAGGSTPCQLYTLLAQPDRMVQIDWSRVQVFWGDERCVPPDDPNSNYLLARQAFLEHVPLPAENIHRVIGELDPDQAALGYENELRHVFSEAVYPRFDLVLLGLGEDGHTASLFPGSPALTETKRLVFPVEHHLPPPPLVTRISFTLAVINAAANVLFLVSGSGKAAIFSQVLQNQAGRPLMPAQMIHPKDGRLIWAADRPAAVEYLKQVE